MVTVTQSARPLSQSALINHPHLHITDMPSICGSVLGNKLQIHFLEENPLKLWAKADHKWLCGCYGDASRQGHACCYLLHLLEHLFGWFLLELCEGEKLQSEHSHLMRHGVFFNNSSIKTTKLETRNVTHNKYSTSDHNVRVCLSVDFRLNLICKFLSHPAAYFIKIVPIAFLSHVFIEIWHWMILAACLNIYMTLPAKSYG